MPERSHWYCCECFLGPHSYVIEPGCSSCGHWRCQICILDLYGATLFAGRLTLTSLVSILICIQVLNQLSITTQDYNTLHSQGVKHCDHSTPHSQGVKHRDHNTLYSQGVKHRDHNALALRILLKDPANGSAKLIHAMKAMHIRSLERLRVLFLP